MAARAPLVLLHPFPSDGRFWDPVAAALRPERPVQVPEFPGLGRAPLTAAPSIDGWADAAAALIGAEALEGAAVCGVSMGGYAALALAARHPDRVRALVLACTRADPDDAAAREGRARSARRLRAGEAAAVLDELVPRLVAPAAGAALARARAIAGEQDPEALARALEALADRADRRPDLPAISAPALVVSADEDRVIPPAAMDALAEALPDAERERMAGAGHLGPLERPEEFAALVRSFLARRADG